MVGKPDPMMMPGFPKETTFNPYLVLRNTTEKPLAVSLQLNYMMGMAGGDPVTQDLPSQLLRPFESRQVQLEAALDAAGLKNFDGSINLSTSITGKPGDLVLATGSVDETGTYVFEVEPQGVGTSRSKFASYWGVSNGNDTMFTLWNPTAAAQDILVTFYYGDGSGKYNLPVHLGPQASIMIDMAMLIAENRPDPDGHLIPSNIHEGSAQFASANGRNETINLAIAGGIYNVSTATCIGGCISCCGVSNFGISPGSLSCAVGGTATATTSAVDCNGFQVYPVWSSSNTTVATVDSNGNVSCASAGQATITAYWGNAVTTSNGGLQQFCGISSCPTTNQQSSVTATVKPTITSISPPRGMVGTATGVTINGTGFISGSTQVNAGSNISVTNVSVSSPTQLTATFTPTNSASAGGNQSVKVAVNGQPSDSSVNFFVQVPTKLVRLDFPGALMGVGPLKAVPPGDVIDLNGNHVRTNVCGVYRNYAFDIEDSNSTTINGTYTFTEMFSNYSSTVPGLTVPPSKSFNFTGDGAVTDIQAFTTVLPACPGSNDHESFDMTFSVTVGGTVYPISTVQHIERGNYSGTSKVDATITTP